MSRWSVAVLYVSMFCATSAYCQDRSVSEDYDTQTIQGGQVRALGEDIFSDTIDYASGSMRVLVTDVALPGNNELPVAVQRVFESSDDGIRMMQWSDYELPYLSSLNRSSGWEGSDATNPDLRCSSGQAPEVDQSSGKADRFFPEDYWHGVYLNTPGGGSELMQGWNPTVTTGAPSDGAGYHWVTQSRWFFSCLSSTSNGAAGEGFLARSPDGHKYWFDRLVGWQTATGIVKANDAGSTSGLRRNEYRMLPSRVEDRFGNWVTYAYDDKKLTAIESNDGRKLTLTYDPTSGKLSAVSDGVRIWRYDYENGISVTYPDQTVWRASLSGVGIVRHRDDCTGPLEPRYTGEAFLTIEHPSGATSQYRLAPLTRGVSFVPYNGIGGASRCQYTPYLVDSIAVYSKTITGAGLVPQAWSIAYGAANECYQHVSGYAPSKPCTVDSPTTRIVDVTSPQGFSRYTIGNKYHDNEGATLRIDRGASLASLKEAETFQYSLLPPVGGYFNMAGDNFFAYNQRVQDVHTITRDGVSFVDRVNSRDALGRATSRTASSSLGYSRTDTVVYYDNSSLWVLGQVASTSTNTVPVTVTGSTQYDTNAMPWKTFGYGTSANPGLLLTTTTYNTAATIASGQRGTISSIADGKGNATSYLDWRRGKPGRVRFPATDEAPAGAEQIAAINNDGNFDSVTDEAGSKTCYEWDPMGRLKRVVFPSEVQLNPTCNLDSWDDVTYTFLPGGAAYGLPDGHWTQTVTKGKAITVTHLDAMWRPIAVESYDDTSAATRADTRSITVTRYDAAGRTIFQSYPTTTPVAYTDPSLKGIYWTYDSLGRVTRTEQDSEYGRLPSTIDYQAGLKTVETNAGGKVTTTSYFALGAPSYEYPTLVEQPEGVTTTIQRDVFGKPTSITRSSR